MEIKRKRSPRRMCLVLLATTCLIAIAIGITRALVGPFIPPGIDGKSYPKNG